MPEVDKHLVQRFNHGAAAITVNSDCMEVILFGGNNNSGLLLADTVVVRFGESIIMLNKGTHYKWLDIT